MALAMEGINPRADPLPPDLALALSTSTGSGLHLVDGDDGAGASGAGGAGFSDPVLARKTSSAGDATAAAGHGTSSVSNGAPDGPLAVLSRSPSASLLARLFGRGTSRRTQENSREGTRMTPENSREPTRMPSRNTSKSSLN